MSPNNRGEEDWLLEPKSVRSWLGSPDHRPQIIRLGSWLILRGLKFDQVLEKTSRIIKRRDYYQSILFHYGQLPADNNGLEKYQQDTNCEFKKNHFGFSHVASPLVYF